MGVFKGFTFDGISSLDYGIYTTGTSVYNAPERDVEMIEIAGKNGALAIDNGRWQNIEVTYTCSTFAQDSEEFAEKLRAFINEICSRVSYVRLEDDYNPDEYRLALYRAGVDVEAAARNKAGEFDLVFECKPQRFLASGEEMITVGDWGDVTEYSGDIVTFEADEMTAIKSLSVDLSPVQNLNGYDHPWVGGAGKNKLVYPYRQNSVTVNGVTATANSDGTVTVNGTCTATGSYMWLYGSSVTSLMSTLNEGESYTYSLEGAVEGLNGQVIFYGSPSVVHNVKGGHTDKSVTFTVPDMSGYNGFAVVLAFVNGFTYNNVTVKPMIRLSSVTDATWERYENICPISGWDGVSVNVAGDNLLPLDTGYPNKYLNGTGELTNLNGAWTSDFIAVKATAYTAKSSEADLVVCTYDANKAFIARYYRGTNFNRAMSFTPQTGDMENVRYIRLSHTVAATTPGVGIQLNFGTTATDYEPYQGETYTQEFIDQQGNTLTVYGGDSEIVGGVLRVTHKMLNLDGNALKSASMNVYMNVNRFGFNFGVGNVPRYNGRDTFCMSDRAEVSYMQTIGGGSSEGVDGVYCYPHTSAIFLSFGINRGIDTRDKCDAWLQENPVQVVYELATPITYTLTPQQVETLIGTNNVWSDAGEVTVEVADDPNKIINPTLYNAKPLIKVSGYGTVTIGSVTITIEGSASDVTYIDCDSMECYRHNGQAIVSANSAVSFSSYDFPVLAADAITGISYSTNISQVQIVPRWWQL